MDNLNFPDHDWRILYISNGTDYYLIKRLTERISKTRLEILTLKMKNNLSYKVRTCIDVDTFTKDVLSGSLYAIAKNATEIHIFENNGRYIYKIYIVKYKYLFSLNYFNQVYTFPKSKLE